MSIFRSQTSKRSKTRSLKKTEEQEEPKKLEEQEEPKKEIVRNDVQKTSDNKLKNLCLELANANTEMDIIDILERAGYWSDPHVWIYYGDNENNFATVGNQQAAPDTALVEKIINSVDAVLMRECLKANINPEGSDAPKSLRDALEIFFDISNGILTNVLPKKRSELAQNIMLIATGGKSNPCYSIIDKGEGQTPLNFSRTFLSLIRSNKLRIPFVQGKFNMGGTGSLQFCGSHNIQLIISRRCPNILDKDDYTSEYWGFTVVRRDNPIKGLRSSSFKYLAPNNNILMFDSDNLPLLPGVYPIAYENPLEWGTFIKLYEYQLIGLKSPVSFDLYYRLSLLLPNIALPVILYERRHGYESQTYHTILSGLSVRLDEDKFDNIENGFPSSGTIKIKGQEMKVQIYVFKKDKKRHYAREEGIVFTVNGQAHGFTEKTFFTRQNVGMSYLADSIIILIDCSNLDGRTREDLFMNSRDRLRKGILKNDIETKLEDLLKNHQGLRELNNKRRRDEIEDKIADPTQTVGVIEKVIKSSPTLSKLFIEGVKITNPFKFAYTGVKEGEYKGRTFPTFFIPKYDFTEDKPKHCPINQRFRIQYETDAENNYFTRDANPGENTLVFGENGTSPDCIVNIWNGIANVTVELPKASQIGDLIQFALEIKDVSRTEPFLLKFFVLVDPSIEKRPGGKGERIKQPDDRPGNKRKRPLSLEIPNMKDVYQAQWHKHGFDKESALKVIDSGEDGYDFYINMDNVYLLTEIKGKINMKPDVLKSQYKYGMILIGISLLRSEGITEKEEEKEEDKEEKFKSEKEPIYERISKTTKAIAPILLPMISALGELEE